MTATRSRRGARAVLFAATIAPMATMATDCGFIKTLLEEAKGEFQSIRDKDSRDGDYEDSTYTLPGAQTCYLDFEQEPATYACRWVYSKFSKETEISQQARNLALLVAQCSGELSEGYQSKDNIPTVLVQIPGTDQAYEVSVRFQMAGTPGQSQTTIMFWFKPEYFAYSELRKLSDPKYWERLR